MKAIGQFVSALGMLLAAGCASLPSIDDRVASSALRDTADTRLGKAIAPLAARYAGAHGATGASAEPGKPVKSGLYALAGGREVADLDVLAVGAIAGQVSTDFDRYWSSESAFPVDRLLQPVSEDTVAREYSEAVQKTSFLRELFEGQLKLEWAITRMISDDPAKVLKKSASAAKLSERLEEIIGTPKSLLELVSPYFVPMQEGVDYLVALARQGVEIRVLTNSLAATDVVAVYPGYARWRKPLLEAGIALHEYKPLSPTPRSDGSSASGRRSRSPALGDSIGRGGAGRSGGSGSTGSAGSGGSIGSLGSIGPGGSGRFGSSSSSLHAKTFSVDRSRVVIGSFNFDPRSAELNTELAFIIDSPALARSVDRGMLRARSGHLRSCRALGQRRACSTWAAARACRRACLPRTRWPASWRSTTIRRSSRN